MYLRSFVQRLLNCLRTEARTLWLHAHSRQSIPTQTGLATIGEAWRQNTTLATAARDCQALVNIVPTHGRSLTSPCELGPCEFRILSSYRCNRVAPVRHLVERGNTER
jgi:hypothetical protein